MSITELTTQLQQIMAVSQVFQAIPDAQRQALLAGMEKADEAQLKDMITIIQEEESNFQQTQKQRLNNAQNQITLSEDLHKQLKDSDKYILKKDEEEDQNQSQVLLKTMESQLTPDKSTAKPQKKKFLGIF